MAVSLLVPEKQILAVGRVDTGPMLLRLFDCRRCGMFVTRVGDAEIAQPGNDGLFQMVDDEGS
jgi:hypothetical protein